MFPETVKGPVIEESLGDAPILKKLKIISTKRETVTFKHKTPWIKQWTLHTIEIPAERMETITEEISKSLDSQHPWYADFKTEKQHCIIFRNKIFCVDRMSKQQYDAAKQYGISLGIPEYQVNFHPTVKEWKRKK